MTTSKVKNITKTESWVGKFGQMYTFHLEMENGDMIKLSKQKSDAFKVGSEISYEKDGDKRKEIKENKSKGSYNESNNKGAMLGLAIKIAFEKEYKSEDDYQKSIYLAQRLFEDCMDIYDGKLQIQKTPQTKSETETQKQETKNEEDLPF